MTCSRIAHRLLVGLLLLVALGRPGGALAAPNRTTVALIETSDARAEILDREARRALAAAEVTVVEVSDAELNGFKGARSIECLNNREDCSYLLSRSPTNWILHLRSQTDAGGEETTIRLIARLYGGEDGGLLQADQRVCERCGSEERLATLTAELVGAIVQAQIARSAPDTYVEVQGSPAGATLAIDGEVVGSVGQRFRVSPGSHELTLSHPGYIEHHQTVHVDANEHRSLRVQLLSQADDDDGPSSTELPWGWISIGTGSLVLGTGVVLLALDGDSADGDARDELYDTSALGYGSITAGTLLVGAGLGWLLLGSENEEDDTRVGVLPSSSGLSVGIGGSF